MKKNLKIIIVSLILLSCSKNGFEKQLIGTWKSHPAYGASDLRFYKDSVVSYEYGRKKKGTWKANSSQIKLHLPQKDIGYSESYILDYKINDNKDSLYIKNIADSSYTSQALIKVTDDWEYYLKKIGLQIELPEANFELTEKDSTWLGIDLFLAYQNDSLQIANEYGTKLNIHKDLKYYIFGERAKMKEEEIHKMNYHLIIDKSVSEQDVDSIKSLLKELPNMKFFRVYKKNESNYGKYDFYMNVKKWNWYGKYE